MKVLLHSELVARGIIAVYVLSIGLAGFWVIVFGGERVVLSEQLTWFSDDGYAEGEMGEGSLLCKCPNVKVDSWLFLWLMWCWDVCAPTSILTRLPLQQT